LPPVHADFLLVLLFDLEYGGDVFIGNIGLPELHCITVQKSELLVVTSMRTSNPIFRDLFLCSEDDS
jgi:hypothetical protein